MNGCLVWLDRVLAATMPQPQTPPVTFAEAMDGLYTARYTGPVTLHFAEGQPKAVEIAATEKVKLR